MMTILIFLFAILLFAKMHLHSYIANKNGGEMYVRGIMNYHFFELISPYRRRVSKDTKKLKIICNTMYYVSLLCFFIALVMKNL